MKTKKIIEITESDILEHFISVSEDCTITDARKIISQANIFWDIKDNKEHEGENRYGINKLEITLQK